MDTANDNAVALAEVSLEDKYAKPEGAVYLTGVQALVRLLLMQQRRDQVAGLNTAGFVSGYRGSPLGGLDFTLWQAKRHLDDANVRFTPGLNEDLAATAVWGSQQTDVFGGARYDGVFGMWYGKNPGVDRTGDVFKHANTYGTSKHGGVLAVSGDDPAASSSTVPSQCEHAFISAMMPVLYPANVAEILEMGLVGYAASRYSGLWMGMKTVADTLETTATINPGPLANAFALPENFEMPPDGVSTRWPDDRWSQDVRLQNVKIPAVMAFARANRLDRTMLDAPKRRIGLVAAGKTYLDLRQALDDLGIDEAVAAEIGLCLYKVGMVWPLETEGATEFASGLEELFVVEERRSIVETQLKELTFHWPADRRPRIVGKTDEAGVPLIPSTGETSPKLLARVVGRRLAAMTGHPAITAALERLESAAATPARTGKTMRVPYFCAGCPHARSTRLPDGSRAMAGIGCHSLSVWVPGSNTMTLCQMGGEGASWIGASPFLEDDHIFQNMGDGTYYHSGLLAIRAAIAAEVRITYKVLYNAAVAMTGGQPVEGAPDAVAIAWQVHSEGAGKVVIVAEDLARYAHGRKPPPGVPVRPREDMDLVMEECRDWPGVSVIVYDQICATEKRRLRKRGTFVGDESRVFINEMVCEGCGDCSRKSRCVAVHLKETEFGPKRVIDQSTCNTDRSCADGFCPSFVTVEGGSLRKSKPVESLGDVELPAPASPRIDGSYDIIIAGVGGTGLITIGALIGMAAHLEGKQCSILDNTGLARKGGGVTTHVRLAAADTELHAARIGENSARLVIGGDLVVTSSADVLSRSRLGEARAVINHHAIPTSAQALDPDAAFDAGELERLIEEAYGEGNILASDVTMLAAALMGDSIYANIMLLGMAFQLGGVPLSEAAILKSIEMNGIAVEANTAAFTWGRLQAHDEAGLRATAGISPTDSEPETLMDITARRAVFLNAYQNKAYGERYQHLVTAAAHAEAAVEKSVGKFSDAVARGFFKLMAYKDEYEVARLYSHPVFRKSLEETFDGPLKLTFHLAPPLLSQSGTANGKRAYGPWMMTAFDLLAKLKFLRGTAFDPFGYLADRKTERRLIDEYEADIQAVLAKLSVNNLETAIEIAALPDVIRGYGHVKAQAIADAAVRRAELLDKFNSSHEAPA